MLPSPSDIRAWTCSQLLVRTLHHSLECGERWPPCSPPIGDYTGLRQQYKQHPEHTASLDLELQNASASSATCPTHPGHDWDRDPWDKPVPVQEPPPPVIVAEPQSQQSQLVFIDLLQPGYPEQGKHHKDNQNQTVTRSSHPYSPPPNT